MQKSSSSPYIPALGFHFLTPVYDLVVRLTGRERTVKQTLINQADLQPGKRVLDLACGTGTLTVWAKQHQPLAAVTGVDGDQRVLVRATAKARRAAAEIVFHQALSFHLPYGDEQFERVLSTMFFHHLTWADKHRTMREVFRVLKPGGEFHFADWGAPANPLMRGLFLIVQLLDGFDTTCDHSRGRIPSLFVDNGFVEVSQRRVVNTIYGTIRLISAVKPG